MSEARALETCPKDAAAEARGKIMALEAAILAHPDRVVAFPLQHYFAPGLYLREMTMPKNAVLTGKIHKTEHLCILSKGKVSVQTEDGLQIVTAPAVVHSMPGAKRAIFAHEESVWTNIHHNPTDERDLEKIEALYVTDTYEQFLAFAERANIEGGK